MLETITNVVKLKRERSGSAMVQTMTSHELQLKTDPSKIQSLFTCCKLNEVTPMPGKWSRLCFKLNEVTPMPRKYEAPPESGELNTTPKLNKTASPELNKSFNFVGVASPQF